MNVCSGLNKNYRNTFRFIYSKRRMGNRPVARTTLVFGDYLENVRLLAPFHANDALLEKPHCNLLKCEMNSCNLFVSIVDSGN
jgi:hypothetical protein